MTSGRPVDILIGPAGTGKSRMMGTLAALWAEQAAGNVVGVATAENAAQVLAAEGIAAGLQHRPVPRPRRPRRGSCSSAGDLLIVDEAGMVPTARADRAAPPRPGGRRQAAARRRPGPASQRRRWRGLRHARPRARPLPAHHRAAHGRSGGSGKPRCACATATPPCSPTTTGTDGSPRAPPRRWRGRLRRLARRPHRRPRLPADRRRPTSRPPSCAARARADLAASAWSRRTARSRSPTATTPAPGIWSRPAATAAPLRTVTAGG